MKYLFTAVLALVITTSAALSGPVKAVQLDVSGDTVLVVRAFPVKITAPKEGSDYTWSYPSAVTAEESDGNVLTVTAAPKGSYKIRIKVTYIDFDAKKIKTDRGEVTLVIGEVTPGPGPTPDPIPPGPKPDPTPPKVGKVYVVCLMDDVRTQAQSKVVANMEMWAKLETAGNRFRVYEKTRDAALITDKKLAKYGTSVGYPCLVIMDGTGGVLKAQTFPATSDELENIVRNYNK